MTEQLYVHYDGQLVGSLTLRDSLQMRFEYSPDWSRSPSSFPISISLPLDGLFDLSASHRFFANLLPEANVRLQICRSLGISQDNDFALLKAIGGDCAGALTITQQSATSGKQSHNDPDTQRYEEITEDQLASWSVGTPEAFSAITGRNDIRLSLAGAQDKLPVHVQDGRIFVPIGDTPSTHLLKFASPFYSHLPENETFVTMLARAVGLPSVEMVLHLAMSLGGETDPGQIGHSHLQKLATDLRINAKTLVGTANRLCDQISDAINETAQSFESRFGPTPVLERIPLIIRKQIRRLKQGLKSHAHLG